MSAGHLLNSDHAIFLSIAMNIITIIIIIIFLLLCLGWSKLEYLQNSNAGARQATESVANWVVFSGRL